MFALARLRANNKPVLAEAAFAARVSYSGGRLAFVVNPRRDRFAFRNDRSIIFNGENNGLVCIVWNSPKIVVLKTKEIFGC